MATSADSSDNDLTKLVEDVGVTVIRGPLDDVLGRALLAAECLGWQSFARLCADRPFFDVAQLQEALAVVNGAEAFDMASNNLGAGAPAGLTTEAIRIEALQRAAAASSSIRHREHLSSYLYENPHLFKLWPMMRLPIPGDQPVKSFAVDTLDDYRVLGALADGCNPSVSLLELACREKV